jgi:hypothetical protein
MKRYTRSVSEIWENCKGAAKLGVYPFDHTSYEDHGDSLSKPQNLQNSDNSARGERKSLALWGSSALGSRRPGCRPYRFGPMAAR